MTPDSNETEIDATDVPEDEIDRADERAPTAITLETMLAELRECTDTDFAKSKTDYQSYMVRAQLEIQNTGFHDRLVEIHESLSEQFVARKIRAIESWSNGESQFRIVAKPWESMLDKLYRINKEDNRVFSNPPIVPTIDEMAAGEKQGRHQRWITPENAHEVVDDLIRTKFVVPFVDGVVEVSEQITRAINDHGLKRFKRYHAKDTGYHARHYYVLLPVPGDDATPETTVALEIKVLTKIQDQLGELTHILYEKHRTGEIKLEHKRKVAWQLGTPDFLATYLGHTGHFLEAAICDLKNEILKLDGTPNGES